MTSKDYYKVLDVSQAADLHEIKKAYRQLAMKYHPDKTDNNQVATAHFREIREAYHILSDPQRRSAYNQQRWYNKMLYSKPAAEPVTPQLVLEKSRKLNRYVSTLGTSRVNEPALYQYLLQLLSENSINILEGANQFSTNQLIIAELLLAMQSLSFPHADTISRLLLRLAGDDHLTIESIQKYLKEKSISQYWQRYQGLMILLIAILICCIIYLVGK
jgi:molecular chaperone DnaJ